MSKSTNPDTVVTVAIGRLDSKGKLLTDSQWLKVNQDFCGVAITKELVASAYGVGRTTDQPTAQMETCCVLIFVNPDITLLRREIACILDRYSLSSACFAIDRDHQPVRANET